MITRRAIVASLVASPAISVFSANRASAQLGPPDPNSPDPILTVTGKITGGSVTFSLPQLQALSLIEFKTSTPWYKGEKTFQGISLQQLMARVGCYGTKAQAWALDDYMVELPVSDFMKFNPILATKMDGAYMPVADRGPLWIIYPFDQTASLRKNVYYDRCVWQLQRLVLT